jgi:pimeloyl-ACP methyl ester carboxylesterase
VLRYDERCCGLSDPDPRVLSLGAFVSDLEAVVDAAGLERFTLLAISQGGAVAVEYAARHPERVERLVSAAHMHAVVFAAAAATRPRSMPRASSWPGSAGAVTTRRSGGCSRTG